MRYWVKRNGEGIIGIYPTFGGALRAVKRYMNEGKRQNTFTMAARLAFGQKDYYRMRTITIGEDVLAFSWAISRKEAEKLYRMGV
jgi:hypothetical protein